MIITVTYRVDKALFDESGQKASLITTEHTYKTDLLVHLQIERNLGIRLSNRLRDILPEGVQNEQFLYKKTYNEDKTRLVSRDAFEERLQRFDKNRTVTTQEILVDYAYAGKDGKADEVQIIITIEKESASAVIDFKDMEQYNNFICPAWLLQLIET